MGFLYTVIAVLFAVSIHEAAHAFAADRLGDPTGRMQGRVSLNPIRHLDLVGSLIVPIFMYMTAGFVIGWGKPVPFNPANLKHPRRDSALIALAGPASNLLSAVIVALPLKYLSTSFMVSTVIAGILGSFLVISIVLFAVNILPFPPLDGSKIVGIFIPTKFQRFYNNYLYEGVKYFILFIVFDFIFLEKIIGFSVLSYLIGCIYSVVSTFVFLGT